MPSRPRLSPFTGSWKFRSESRSRCTAPRSGRCREVGSISPKHFINHTTADEAIQESPGVALSKRPVNGEQATCILDRLKSEAVVAYAQVHFDLFCFSDFRMYFFDVCTKARRSRHLHRLPQHLADPHRQLRTRRTPRLPAASHCNARRGTRLRLRH